MSQVVVRYLEAVVAHDWAALADCLTPDVVRVGPYGDTYTSRDAYVEFLTGLMPALPGYSMQVHRVVGDGPVVAELSETVEVDGSPLVTPESLVFDLAVDGRIERITIYIQQTGEPPKIPT